MEAQIQKMHDGLYIEGFSLSEYAYRAATILGKSHTSPCCDNGSFCKVSHNGLSVLEDNEYGINEYTARCYEQCPHGIFLHAIIDGVRVRVLTPEEEKYCIDLGRVPVEENGCVLLKFPK